VEEFEDDAPTESVELTIPQRVRLGGPAEERPKKRCWLLRSSDDHPIRFPGSRTLSKELVGHLRYELESRAAPGDYGGLDETTSGSCSGKDNVGCR